MIHHSLIVDICDKFGVGHDVAGIIETFVVRSCCSALPIKKELQKLVDYALSFSYKLADCRNVGYYEITIQSGLTIVARNIIGSFGISVGKENYIDYSKLSQYSFYKKSIVYYFLLINKQIPQK